MHMLRIVVFVSSMSYASWVLHQRYYLSHIYCHLNCFITDEQGKSFLNKSGNCTVEATTQQHNDVSDMEVR